MKPNYPLMDTYLSTLLLELKPFSTNLDKVKENAASRVTRQYKIALVQHIYKKQSVSDYAAMLAVTADNLNKCVKATTGNYNQQRPFF